MPTVPSRVGEHVAPRDVGGGWTPKPRNDSVDSVTIAAAIASVAFTMIGADRVRQDVADDDPRGSTRRDARAASTNSFSFSDSTWPRTTRAMYVQPRNARTTIIAS